ncbi:hypothetical protein ACUODJ_42080, partial [Escherichia sp. HC-CC]
MGVVHYVVYREISGVMSKIGIANTASFVDQKLKDNTSYKYVVAAVDVAGNESRKSDALLASHFSYVGFSNFVVTVKTSLL